MFFITVRLSPCVTTQVARRYRDRIRSMIANLFYLSVRRPSKSSIGKFVRSQCKHYRDFHEEL